MAAHWHRLPDSFLNEQVLINISEKVQFHVHHFNNSLSGQTSGNVITSRIMTISLEAHVSKILQYVGK